MRSFRRCPDCVVGEPHVCPKWPTGEYRLPLTPPWWLPLLGLVAGLIVLAVVA